MASSKRVKLARHDDETQRQFGDALSEQLNIFMNEHREAVYNVMRIEK